MNKPILLYNPIFNYTAETYTEKLLDIDSKETSVTWLNSPGGSVFAGWSIIGALQEREGENHVKVMGNASSMAFFMTLFMDKVEALEVSTFLIHRADGYVSTEEDKAFLKSINDQLRAKFESRIDQDKFKEVTGVSFDEIFATDTRKDVVITAKQAKKIGLVDKIIRLETQEIKAIQDQFMALGVLEEQGSEASSQGSEDTQKEPTINNTNNNNKMDLRTLKAEHPEIVAQIEKDAIVSERDRVNAYLAYVDIDAEAVKKGIESGENPTLTFAAEMTRKGMSAMATVAAAEDSIDTVETTVEPTANQTEQDELAKLEKEAFASAKIEGKEDK